MYICIYIIHMCACVYLTLLYVYTINIALIVFNNFQQINYFILIEYKIQFINVKYQFQNYEY